MAANVQTLLRRLHDDENEKVDDVLRDSDSLTFADAKAIADGKKQLWVVEPQSYDTVTLLTADHFMFEDRDGDDDDHIGYFYKHTGDAATGVVGSGGGFDTYPKVGPTLLRHLRQLTTNAA